MEEKSFTWIPFYKELAKALLKYKEDRKPLVDWIYAELSKVKGIGGKSLVEYIHNKDKSKVTDIDPFSVIAIFNRGGLTIENRINFCEKFKTLFGLNSEIPQNFDGIPTVFAMKAFFFHWERQSRTEYLWDLLEKVVYNQDISETFNKLLEDEMPKNTLTMILYWVSPEQYLALDSRNRSFFQNYGLTADGPAFNYNSYMEIVEKAKKMMRDGTVNCKTFPELSHLAWKISQTSNLWMFYGDEKTFFNDELKMGSSAKGNIKNFEDFKSKTALREAYRKAVDNKDVSIPQMYWEFIHEVKFGDIVVVFATRRNPKPQHHVLYGWGRISSDVYYNYDDENPIIRKVEWNHPRPQEPIKETRTKNALYFHEVNGTEAANIMKLLDINEKGETTMNNSNNDILIDLLKTNKNLILTGAPGTGKTYKAKEMARQILGLDSVEALKNDKRFGFVQFHPSYDYTDFVEGLRPKNEVNGNIGFERKDGIFKEFCKQAILSETADADILADINSNPTVWKVSLEGTGDNPTRTDCMENDYIRIGWEKYGDVDFSDYNDYFEGGKNVLRAFQNGMQIGDLVVSCYSAKEIDAVGIITGDYEYRSEGGKYPRYRTVKWLVKNIRENIVELNNNKAFTLSTVYKSGITAEAALKIVKEHTMQTDIAHRGDAAVFVIDEINRGEISKIFGELFFSIDPGYRGVKGAIKTQYQNLVEEGDAFKDGFFVPENVYIIGTMNDIDRSVESMDFAMRRRFAWKEVTAEQSYENMIENDSKFSDAIKAVIQQRMFSLNKAIEKTEGLGKSYQIGAAYFRKYLDYKDQSKPFDYLWENHLEGLLSEYLRGNRKADELLKNLRKAYNQTSADEQPAINNEG